MFSLENVTLSLVNCDHLISHNACIIYHLLNRPWENTTKMKPIKSFELRVMNRSGLNISN